MFTSVTASAGIEDVADKVRKENNNIDGVNSNDCWPGKSDHSERNFELYYFEGQLTAVRMGAWKWHFALKEDYYDNMTGRNFPKVFSLRMDPFESYDTPDSYGHLAQQVSWQMAPMNELIDAHLKTLADYPPVKPNKSFNMAEIVPDFLSKGQQ